MRTTFLKSVLSIATLGVALPVTAAGIGGAVEAAAAGRANIGGAPDISMPSEANMGAAAAGRADAGLDAAAAASQMGADAAGRAGAATEALGNAGASDRAMEAIGEGSADSRAGMALDESGPADAALSGPTGANANASLTGRVQSTLHSNSELRGLGIESNIEEDGSVTLNGTVENADQKEKAEELVANIEGVSSVNSNLTVAGN